MTAADFAAVPAAALAMVLAALPLAGCSRPSAPPAVAQGEERIACAVGGAGTLKPVCGVERRRVDGHLLLVVHHPDGGFRRFDVQSDGTGLAVSDGADRAVLHVLGSKLDVSVGPDRYIFPVTMKARDKTDAHPVRKSPP
ncbi:hypothetical protein MTR62_04825 [Novosphingobium sp. 1949]|uniref:Lipoprotein n=1 Tax=Novosphingobium organovorum TaxID=2930092 RepID=A0ABT0BB06_9SPHN|nr:hypothetical protein [Novosphingobium organovorum]MCJ2182028.1 hypothetical protein [Novosphingobium organovorum]